MIGMRGRVRCEHRLRPTVASSWREDGCLRLGVLDGSLDDEVSVGQGLKVVGVAKVGERAVVQLVG